MFRQIQHNIIEHPSCAKKIPVWAVRLGSRTLNSKKEFKNILNQDLPIFKTVADPFDASELKMNEPYGSDANEKSFRCRCLLGLLQFFNGCIDGGLQLIRKNRFVIGALFGGAE